jgi:hypothetical protein
VGRICVYIWTPQVVRGRTKSIKIEIETIIKINNNKVYIEALITEVISLLNLMAE